MPYDPSAITADERTYAYKAMWAGLPNSLALLVCVQFEALSFLAIVPGGFICGIFIGQAWSWSYDEFMRNEVAFASGWALSLAGIVLFLALLPRSFRIEVETDLAIACMAFVFHCAIYWRRIRDGAFTGGGA